MRQVKSLCCPKGGRSFAMFLLYFLIGTACLGGLNLFLAHKYQPIGISQDDFFLNKLMPERYPVVIYGDSRTYRGIETAVFQRGWNVPCMNFGFSSGGVNDEILRFLDSRLDDTADHPGVVIIGITPLNMSADTRANKHYNLLRKSGGKKAKPDQSRNFFQLFFQNFSQERVNELEVIKAQKRADKKKVTEIYHPDGWCETVCGEKVDRAKKLEKTLESYSAAFRRNKYSPQSEKELLHWVSVWKDRGVRVFFFRTPAGKKVIELENSMSGFVQEDFVRKMEEAGACFIPVDCTAYPSYDGSHLDRDAAEKLTKEIFSFIDSRIKRKK